jgi:gluconate 5-dehydrogenase
MSRAASHFFDLTGRTALVTGGGRGIGLAISQGLADAGASVLINGRDEVVLEQAVSHICKEGGDAAALAFDIADPDQVEAAFHGLNSLDILINNVGVRNRGPIDAFTLDDFRALLDTNLIAAFDLSRRAAALMKKQRRGRIINVTSIAGNIARSGDALYTASKAALTGLTRAMAAEFGPDAITVNAIAPGYVATETNAAMVADPEIAKFLANRTALGRWADPEELAGAAVFLASGAASYITGQVLTVDGGFTAHF